MIKLQKILFFLCVIIFNIPFSYSNVFINELMSKNVSCKMYHLGNVYGFAGWVELRNDGIDSVDLKGYTFLDHEGKVWKCSTTTIIAPDSFYVLWFSELNKENHTSFKLDPEGGSLVIKNKNDEIVDVFQYPEGIRNLSYGNVEDGEKKEFFCAPSLGSSNKGSCCFSKQISAPTFSLDAGFYTDSIEVEIMAEDFCDIYYTIDGSEPTIKDFLYTMPLLLTKNTVVRAISVKKTLIDTINNNVCYTKSSPVTSTYFVNERDIDLPVVSLSIDSSYMYDDEYGIYVEGNGRYAPKYSGWTWLPYANYWGNEKRPLNFEFFDASEICQINQEIGVSVYGGYSRSYDKKSLELNPAKIYGDNQFRYPLFQSKQNIKLKSILLRSSGQDYSHSYLRDAFINTLVEGCIDLDMQAYTPSVVYLNGSYWGLMNLRERHNDDYIYSNYGLDEDSITQNLSGSAKYSKLKKCADINSAEANALIDSLFDINEILNFTLTQIYCANTDWGGNNVTFWSRKNDEYWRVILYDTDEGFSNGGDKNNLNTVSYAYKNSVLKFLLGNNRVKNTLLSKAVVHLATTFAPSRVESILDSLSSKIRKEALYYQNFRKKSGLPVSDWESQISKMRVFSNVRPLNVFAHLKSYYSLGDTSAIRFYATEKGTEFYFNEERIKTNDFKSKCFENFSFTLKCCPPDGYLFNYWEVMTEDSVYTYHEECLETVFQGTASYRAVLKQDTLCSTQIPHLYLNEICITNKMFIDEYGESNDWIEVYNAGTSPVDLGGMYFSDKKNNLKKFLIPMDDPQKTTVMPQSYIVFWADESPEQGVNHLSFSLSASKKQTVSLSMIVSDSIVSVIDSVTYELHEKGETFVRFCKDNYDVWTKTRWPTFSSANRFLGYKLGDASEEQNGEISLFESAESYAPIYVYPNPTSDVVFVDFPWDRTSYTIYHNGIVCLKGILNKGQQLDLTSIPDGLYVLSFVNSETGEYGYVKVLKQ